MGRDFREIQLIASNGTECNKQCALYEESSFKKAAPSNMWHEQDSVGVYGMGFQRDPIASNGTESNKQCALHEESSFKKLLLSK